MAGEESRGRGDNVESGDVGTGAADPPTPVADSTRHQDVCEPVRPWSTNAEDIPRSIDRNQPDSRSTTPTLRAESLATLPSGSPETQQQNAVPLHPASIQADVDTAPLRPSALASPSSALETGIEAVGLDVTATGAAFADFGDHSRETGDPTEQQLACHLDLFEQPSGACRPRYQEYPSNPSSVITTPSASAEACDRYTAECVAFLKGGAREPFTALLDTGSGHNVISEEVPARMGIKHLIKPSDDKPIKVINHVVPIIGILPLVFVIPDRVEGLVKVHFKVVPEDDSFDSILGANFFDTHILKSIPSRINQKPVSG